jgi:cellulose synthase operon protein C
VLLVLTGSAPAVHAEAPLDNDAAELLVREACVKSDASDFDAVDTLLSELAQHHTAADARFAAALYAAERAYVAGERDRASRWLEELGAAAAARFATHIANARAWCRISPEELNTTSAELLDLADRRNTTSLAPAALKLRSEKLSSVGRIDEAIFVYQAMLTRFPNFRDASACRLAVAKLHHEQGQHREAQARLEQLLAGDADARLVDAALYLLTQVHAARGNSSASVECWRQIVEDHAESPYWCDAAIRLAAAHFSSDDATAAEKLAAQVADHPAATAELRQRALLLAIKCNAAGSDWERTEALAARLLADEAVDSVGLVAHFWQAEAAYRRGKRDEAWTRFLDLSLGDDLNLDWLGIVPLRLAQIEAHRGEWSTALERVELLLGERPDYSRRYEVDYLHGRCLMALGRLGEARAAFARALDHDAAAGSETAAMAQWMIGETLFLQRRYEEAIAAYELVERHEHATWQAAAVLQTAKCLEQLDRPADAARHYELLLSDFAGSSYAAEATARLELTRQRTAVAAQQPGPTATR